MMLIPNTASTQAGPALGVPISLSTLESIHCDIIFGSPRDDCRGNGICKIVLTEALPAQSTARNECRRARARMQVYGPDMVAIEFQRTDLCAHLYRHYFRQTDFCLPQSCPLPSELLRMTALRGDALQAGNYPLEVIPGGFRVVFGV